MKPNKLSKFLKHKHIPEIKEELAKLKKSKPKEYKELQDLWNKKKHQKLNPSKSQE